MRWIPQAQNYSLLGVLGYSAGKDIPRLHRHSTSWVG